MRYTSRSFVVEGVWGMPPAARVSTTPGAAQIHAHNFTNGFPPLHPPPFPHLRNLQLEMRDDCFCTRNLFYAYGCFIPASILSNECLICRARKDPPRRSPLAATRRTISTTRAPHPQSAPPCAPPFEEWPHPTRRGRVLSERPFQPASVAHFLIVAHARRLHRCRPRGITAAVQAPTTKVPPSAASRCQPAS